MSSTLRTFPDASAARAHLARLAAEAVPIRDWAFARGPELLVGWAPVVLLDAEARPELRQAVELHSQVGEGFACTRWEVLPALEAAVLTVRLQHPASCLFTLAFSFAPEEVLLSALLTAQMLGVVPGTAETRLTLATVRRALIVPCVRQPLGSVFAAWQLRRSLREEGRN